MSLSPIPMFSDTDTVDNTLTSDCIEEFINLLNADEENEVIDPRVFKEDLTEVNLENQL